MTKATGRPRGRPKTKEYKSVTIRFPLAFLEQLQRYAKLKRQTMSDAMRDGAMLLLADVDPYHPSLLSHTNEDAANLSDRKEEVSDMLSDAKADTVIASDSNTISDIVSDRKEAHPPALDFDAPRLTIPGVPTFLFNPAKHAIGPLCKQHHDHTGLGESVRERGGDKPCVECRHERSGRHAAKAHQTRAKRRALHRRHGAGSVTLAE